MSSISPGAAWLADAISADHRALATAGDAVLLLALPTLWLLGVVALIVLKLRSR